jgi:hypothetical protein
VLPGRRACPPSVTRPSGGLPDPWLCGPVLRRVCLYREGSSLWCITGCTVGAKERPSRVREPLNSGNCRKWSCVAELDRRREHQHACRIFEQERGLSGISGSRGLEDVDRGVRGRTRESASTCASSRRRAPIVRRRSVRGFPRSQSCIHRMVSLGRRRDDGTRGRV